MLLFKIMRGTSANISLDVTPFHDGWCYFCTDDGGFYIDSEVDGVQKRTRTNSLRYNEGKIESYENGTWVEVPLDIEELESHVSNDDIHVTVNDKTAWNAKENAGVASSLVTTHNTATDAHNDIRILLEGLTTRLNALANSTDEDLDQMAEVVAYIKSNKELIDAITTSKVSVSDIIDNLTTNVNNKPLSAAQGVALKGLIDAITASSIGALPLSGGTITGTIDANGTSTPMDFGASGFIRGTTASGGKFDIFGYLTPTDLQVGGTYPTLSLKGKGERPTYNDSNMALLSDIEGKADADHTHDGYASSTHTHTEFISQDDLTTHKEDTTVHVTSTEKSTWNGKQAAISGGASTITSSNLTASRALISNSSGKVAVSAVTSTELGYLDGVTSAIQTQLNGKQATISGAATTIASSNLTASRALVSNSSGKVAVSAVTATELGYLDGVTSAIQTQLDGKSSTSHTHSGYASSSHTHSTYVPTTRTVNGKALSANISLTASDVGASATDHTHSGYASSSHTHDGYAASDHTHTGYAASSHNHAATEITSGTLAVARGGTGQTSIADTTYTTARYRASAIVSSATNPSTNGVINWMYE